MRGDPFLCKKGSPHPPLPKTPMWPLGGISNAPRSCRQSQLFRAGRHHQKLFSHRLFSRWTTLPGNVYREAPSPLL